MGRRPRITRDQVLDAARIAFAERGFAGTTLAAIAARLDVSAAALLRHAPTKAALFEAAMAAPRWHGAPLPMAFLPQVPDDADPAPVLRRLAEATIPFIETEMAEGIARWMFARGAEAARRILPFDPRSPDSPPRRVFVVLEDYLRRASRAGRIEVHDPRAAALAFMGGLNAYVFFHKVLRLVDPPVPLEDYVDTLIGLWQHGAIRKGGRRRTPLHPAQRPKARPKRKA